MKPPILWRAIDLPDAFCTTECRAEQVIAYGGPMLHLKLRELYRLLGAEPAHAFLVFGDGHAIPDLSSACMLSWMDRWLKYAGDPLGTWDARPTPTA